MSYVIIIGERTMLGFNHPDYDEEVGEHPIVDIISRTDAPVFINDEMTGNTNARSPAYVVWDNFLSEAGLHSLFFNSNDGLMKDHPGISDLTPEHLKLVTYALEKRKLSSNLPPGFSEFHDGVLARLIWLEFWIKHALQTCTHPSLYNH